MENVEGTELEQVVSTPEGEPEVADLGVEQPDVEAELDNPAQPVLSEEQIKAQADAVAKTALQQISEAKRLESMSDEERAQEEFTKRMADLEKREAALNHKELLASTQAELSKKGLPIDLAEHVAPLGANAETVKAGIDALGKAFNKAVADAVKVQLGTPAPKGAPTRVQASQATGATSVEDIFSGARLID